MGNVVIRVDFRNNQHPLLKLREELEIEECYVEVSAEGDKIVLKPIKSIVDDYFRVRTWTSSW